MNSTFKSELTGLAVILAVGVGLGVTLTVGVGLVVTTDVGSPPPFIDTPPLSNLADIGLS